MTSKVRSKAPSLLAISMVLVVAAACSGDKRKTEDTDLELDAGPPKLSCVIDEDGDGYGVGCSRGEDCNDEDGSVHEDCEPCSVPAEGCACDDAAPIECFKASLPAQDTLLCESGMRYCRDGAWTACEGLTSWEVPVERREEVSTELDDTLGYASQALVGDAGTCSPCKKNCYQVDDYFGTDTLTPDNSSNVSNTTTGGITIDHTTVQTIITSTQTCIPNQCTASSDQTICDDDCDGIPNAYDLATGTKPFGTTASSIFLSLAPGGEGAAVLNLEYYVRTADVYFMIDAGSTMSDELGALYTDMKTGSFLTSNESCGDLNRNGDTSDEEHFKMDGIAGNIACRVRDVNIGLGWFRDIPFTGYGNTNTFGSSPVRTEGNEIFYEHRVDVGYDVDLLRNTISEVMPDADAETATPNATGGIMALHHMATAEEAYFGWNSQGLPGYRPGVDTAPEAGTYAKRYGCDDTAWGYPCFRDTAFPIVVMITDAPLHNGPGTTATSQPVYPYPSLTGQIGGGTTEGWADSKPHYLQTPQIYRTTTKEWVDSNDVETDAISINAFLGGAAPDATKLFTIVGNTRGLTSDVTPSMALCGLTQDAVGPDAFYTFTVPVDTTMTISARGSRFPVLLGVSTSWTDFQNGGTVAGWTEGGTFDLQDLNFSTTTEVATITDPVPLGVDAYFEDSSVTTNGSFPLDVAGIECYSGANDTNKTIGEECPSADGTGGNARACDYGSDMLFKFNVQDGLDLTVDLQDSTANMGISVYDKEPQLPETRELAGSTKTVAVSSPLNAWRFEDKLDSNGDPNPDYTPGAYRFVGDDGIVQGPDDHPSDELLDTTNQANAGLAKWIPATPFNNYTDPDRCNATFSGSSYGWTFDFSLEQGTDAAGTTYPIAIEAIGGGKRNSVSDTAGGNAVKYAIAIAPRTAILTPTKSVNIDPACEDNSTTTTSNAACAVDISSAADFPSSGGYIRLDNGSFNSTSPLTFTADVPGGWMGCSGSGYTAPTGYDTVYKITNTTGSAQLADISADFPVTHLSLHTSALASAVYATPESVVIESVSSTPTVYNNINPATNPAADSTVSGVGLPLDTSAGNQNLAVTLDTAYDRSYSVGLPSTTYLSVPPYPSTDVTTAGNTGFVDATATTVPAATTLAAAEDMAFTSTTDYTSPDYTATLATQSYVTVNGLTTGTGPTLPPSTASADPVNLGSSTVLDNKVYTITGNTGAAINTGDLDITQATWTSSCNNTGGSNKTPDMLVKFTLSASQLVTLSVGATAGANLRAAIFNSTLSTNQFGSGSCAAAGDTKRALLGAGTYYLAFTSNKSSTDSSVGLGTTYLSAEDYAGLTSALAANQKLTFSGSTVNARNNQFPHCDGFTSGSSSADRIHTFKVGSSAVTAKIATTASTDGIVPSSSSVVAGLYLYNTSTNSLSGGNLACLSGAAQVSSNVSLSANTTYAVVVSSSASSTVTYGVTIDTARVESYTLADNVGACATTSVVGSLTCNDHVVFTGSTLANDDSSIPVSASTTGVNGDVIHVFTLPAGYDNLLTITNTANATAFAPVAALFNTGTPNSASTPLTQIDGSTTSITEGSSGTYRIKNASAATYAIVVKGVNGSSGNYSLTVRSGLSAASGETQTTVVLQNTTGGRHVTLTGTTDNRSADVDSGTAIGFPAGCTASSATVGSSATSTEQRDQIRLFSVYGTASVRVKLDTSASAAGTVVGVFNYSGALSTGISPLSGTNCIIDNTPVGYNLGTAGVTTTYALVVSSNVSNGAGAYSVELSTQEIFTHPTALDASSSANHVSFSGSTVGHMSSDTASSYGDVWQVFTVSPGFDNLVRLMNVGDNSPSFQASATLYTYSAGTASLGSAVAQLGGSTAGVPEGSTGSYRLSGATATSYAVVVRDSGAGATHEGAYVFELIAGNAAEGEETYSAAPFTLSATTETVLSGSTSNRSMDLAIAGCSAGDVAQSDIAHRFKVSADTSVTITNKLVGGNSDARAYLLDSTGAPVAASGTLCMTTTTGTNSAVYALSAAEPYYQLVVTSATESAAGQYEVHILPGGLSTSNETRTLTVLEFAPDDLTLNVVQIDGSTASNSADFARTGWDCAGVGSGADPDTVVSFTVPNGFDNTLTVFNQSNGVSFAPAVALYSPGGLLTSMTGKTCIAEGSTLGYHVKNSSGAAQTYYAVISNGGALSGDTGAYTIRINGGTSIDVGESAALSQSGANIDGEYYLVTGDTTNAGSTYDLSTLCGAGFNGKQSDLVRSFKVSSAQDVTISNLASSFSGATVLVMNSGSTISKATGWGCIAAGASTTATLAAGTYDLVIGSKNSNSAGSFALRIAPDKAESFSFGTFASTTANNHVAVSGTVQTDTQNEVPGFGCSVGTQSDTIHVFNLGTSFDNVVRLKNTSAAATVAQLYTYDNVTRSLGSAVLPIPTSSGDGCVGGSGSNETTTYRLASAVSSTGYYAVVVKAAAGTTYSFELIADQSEETTAETYTLASALTGQQVQLNGSTQNRSADQAMTCAYGTPSTKQSDVKHIVQLSSTSTVTVKNVSNGSALSAVAALYSCSTSSCASMTLVGSCIAEGSEASYSSLSAGYYAVMVSAANGSSGGSTYGGHDGAYTLELKASGAVENFTISGNMNTSTTGRDVHLTGGTTVGVSSGAVLGSFFGSSSSKGACVAGTSNSSADVNTTSADVLHTFTMGANATVRIGVDKVSGTNFRPRAALFTGTTPSRATVVVPASGGTGCYGYSTSTSTFGDGEEATYTLTAGTTYTLAVFNGTAGTSSTGTTGATGTYTLDITAPDQLGTAGSIACGYNLAPSSGPVLSGVSIPTGTSYLVAKSAEATSTYTGSFGIDIKRAVSIASSNLLTCASCLTGDPGCIPTGISQAEWVRLETELPAGDYTAIVRPVDGSSTIQPKILLRDLGYLPKPYNQHEPSDEGYVPACQQDSTGQAGAQNAFTTSPDETSALAPFELKDLPSHDADGNLIDYYMLLRGFTKMDTPPDFTIHLFDAQTTTTTPGSSVNYCSATGSDAEITQTFKANLPYKVMVKGLTADPADEGLYNLTFGGAYTTNTFDASGNLTSSTGTGVETSQDVQLASWNGVDPNGSGTLDNVRNELVSRDIRVIGMNTSEGAESAEVFRELNEVAFGTKAIGWTDPLAFTVTSGDLSSQVVKAVEELSLSLASDVGVKLVRTPDDPNGADDDFGFYVRATLDPITAGCASVDDETPDDSYGVDTYRSCKPSATPEFEVTFVNPRYCPPEPNPDRDPLCAPGVESAPVPCKCTSKDPARPECATFDATLGTCGGIGWSMELNLVANSKYIIEKIPVYIIPEAVEGPASTTYYEASGGYWQDFDTDRCGLHETPDWSALEWQAYMPTGSGASIAWDVCTAQSEAALATCSSYTRIATVTYNNAATAADCLAADGYWEANAAKDGVTVPQCHNIVGKACTADSQCGGGSCVNSFCRWTSLPIDLGAMLPPGTNGSPAMRVKAILYATTDKKAAPEVASWTARYWCNPTE